MRLRAVIPAGDYTVTPALIEVKMGLESRSYLWRKIRAWINGNSAAGELGIYQHTASMTSMTSAELAATEEFYDDNVVAKSAPVPELDLAPREEVGIFKESNKSFYVRWKAGAGDTSTNGTVDLILEEV